VVRPAPQLPADPSSLSATARAAWRRITALDPDAFPLEPRALADRIGERTTAAIGRLVRAGFLIPDQMEVVRPRRDAAADFDSLQPAAAAAPPPTPAQRRIIDAIRATLGSFTAHLLFGVTGSGKTEVYLRVL